MDKIKSIVYFSDFMVFLIEKDTKFHCFLCMKKLTQRQINEMSMAQNRLFLAIDKIRSEKNKILAEYKQKKDKNKIRNLLKRILG